jgi:hypothetical protein
MCKKQSSSGLKIHSSECQYLQVAEIIVEAIKAIVWPLSIVMVIIVFYNPLNLIITGLATKINDANKVSLGGFSVEVEEKVRKFADPCLTNHIVTLSPQAIEQLLNTPYNSDFHLLVNLQTDGEKLGLPNEEKLNALIELEKTGFLMFKYPLEPFIKKVMQFARDPTKYKDDGHVYYIIPGGVKAEEYRILTDQRYHLTDDGKKAFKAIIKAVSEIISKP